MCSHFCFVSNVYSSLFHHGVMTNPADQRTFWIEINLSYFGIVSTGLLDTGALASVMPIKIWKRMGFTREDLIPTKLRLVAANCEAIFLAGRTPIIVSHMGERNLWMSILVVANLDGSGQFIFRRDFVRTFEVTIDLNKGVMRMRNPDRKYAKRPINRIIL